MEDYNDGLATIAQRNRFYPGTYDVLSPTRGSYKITVDALFDKDMNPLECARYAAQTVKFYCDPVEKGSFLRVKIR